MLWTSVKEYYPDQTTFIPNISTIVIAWCEAFSTWLENDENSEGVERMLDALKTTNGVKLVLEVTSILLSIIKVTDLVIDCTQRRPSRDYMEYK